MAAAGAGSGFPPGAGTEPLAAGRASPGGLLSVLGALVSPRTWLAVIHLLAGLVIGIVAFTVVVIGIGLGIGLMPIFLVGIPVLVGVIWLAALGGRAERARFAVLLGAVIPAPAPLPDEPRGWRRMNLLFLARSTWLPTVYALIRLPLSAIQAVAVTAVWGVGLALIALPAYNGALPGGSAHLGSFALNNPAWVALGVATGVALVLAAPSLTRALAAEDAAVARWLLGPGRRARLTARIGELETSRAGVVDAAETERRRIERDLHDGAQQRLVSLAMELGRARAKFASDPQSAEAIVGQAHEQAKEALTELRNLVRGVHPPVLSDRGLDAALSGLAALSPVPVTVQVDLAERPSASVEAIAYFVVAEALTNVAKHAKASRALVTVTRSGNLLNVAVGDDGIGGASVAGQGLSGLAARVAGIDGRLLVTSPRRGPHRDRGGAAMRVVVAEDSVLLREGLARLLTEAGHEVEAATGEAEEFLREVAAHRPDVVVVDVRMPPTFTDEGLRAALVVRSTWPDVGVLVLSQYVEERYATELLSDRPQGVGYLLKDRVADLAEFLDALERVAAGGSALDPEVVAQLLARSRHPLAALTPRERDVLALMAEGRSNAAIAAELVVSDGAVEKHINSIFGKLGLAPADRDHRRVLAVLRYLGAEGT